MEHVERLVPSSKSLSVTNNIGSHFSQRQFVYNYPVNAQIADYTVVYLGDAYAWPSAEAQKNMLDSLLKNSAYKLFAQKGNFYAFRRIGL